MVQKILFICKKNFSRSILAEAITNTMAPDRFRAYSAGLEDCGPLPEHLLAFLRSKGVATNRVKSKTFDYFTGLRAVQFDYVITTCDKATAEACPAWPGQPLRAHWDITRPDFDKGEGMGTAQMLERLYQRLYLTISLFVSLPEDARAMLRVDDGISKLHVEALRLAGQKIVDKKTMSRA